MAKPSKSGSSAETARELRQDIYIYNEATGFVVSSKKMKGKGFEPDDNKWTKAAEKGEIIPIELYQDDPFVVRLVLNGKLSKEEEQEWLGKFTHKLRVPDGKLAICGGIEFIMEEFEKEDDWINDFVRYVDIPKGEYKAEIYTYINSVNATPLLEASGAADEPIGTFFRRTRPGAQFPEWLQHWLWAYSAEDPGHESEWQSHGKPEEKYFVDFLIHLSALDEDLPEAPPLEAGFYSWTHNEARKPTVCPLGLPVQDLTGLPEKKEYVPEPVQGVDVFSWVSDFKFTQLPAAVKLDLKDIKLLYLLSWYASSSAHPELRFRADNLEAIETIPLAERCIFKRCSEKVLALQLENSNARWATIARMRDFGKNLHEKKLSDEVSLELCTCWPASMTEIAISRFRGRAIGSSWSIEELYPAMDSSTLERAIKLAAEACQGKELSNLEAEPARLALDLFKEEWEVLFRNNMPELKDGKLTVKEADDSIMHLYMAFYFKLAFNKVWSCQELDPELLDSVQNSKARAELASTVIFEGAGSRKYVGSSIKTFDKDANEDASKWQSAAEKMGGKFIGELACTQFKGFIFRYFTTPHEASRIVWYRNDGMPGSFIEIICDFADGATLFTSRQGGPGDDDKRKVYRLRCPNMELPDMYKKHLERAEQLAKEHGGMKSFDGTLAECAKRFDAGIVRQSS